MALKDWLHESSNTVDELWSLCLLFFDRIADEHFHDVSGEMWGKNDRRDYRRIEYNL